MTVSSISTHCDLHDKYLVCYLMLYVCFLYDEYNYAMETTHYPPCQVKRHKHLLKLMSSLLRFVKNDKNKTSVYIVPPPKRGIKSNLVRFHLRAGAVCCKATRLSKVNGWYVWYETCWLFHFNSSNRLDTPNASTLKLYRFVYTLNHAIQFLIHASTLQATHLNRSCS